MQTTAEWHRQKEERREAKKRPGWRAGHALRSKGFFVVEEKKSSAVVAIARNGCFGNLRGVDDAMYQAYAQGTRAA